MLDFWKWIFVDEYEMIFSELFFEYGESVEYILDVFFLIIKIENDICYYKI